MSEPCQTMLERSFERQQEKEPINREIKHLLNSQMMITIGTHNKDPGYSIMVKWY
jgi:hypothetical protein